MHCKNINGVLVPSEQCSSQDGKAYCWYWNILSGLKNIVSLTLSVEGTTLWRLRRKIVFWADIKSDVRERGEGIRRRVSDLLEMGGGDAGGEEEGFSTYER
jgi:hypothetical protein